MIVPYSGGKSPSYSIELFEGGSILGVSMFWKVSVCECTICRRTSTVLRSFLSKPFFSRKKTKLGQYFGNLHRTTEAYRQLVLEF